RGGRGLEDLRPGRGHGHGPRDGVTAAGGARPARIAGLRCVSGPFPQRIPELDVQTRSTSLTGGERRAAQCIEPRDPARDRGARCSGPADVVPYGDAPATGWVSPWRP